MQYRCLIVDELHPNFKDLFSRAGITIDYHPEYNRSDIKADLKNYDGLIIRSKTFVDDDLLEGSNLLFIGRAGAGVDNLDQAALEKRGVAIINAPEGNRDAVGEHTIGMMLSILHNLQQGHMQVINDIWDREGNRGVELGDLTVGIIGYGNSGSKVGKKLQGFGCRIMAYDKYLTSYEHQSELESIFRQADLITLHIPLTDETMHMVNAAFLSRFSKPIYFLNMSRGEIAPLAELRKAIESGKILKAALDVLECEKLAAMDDQQRIDFEWLKKSGKVFFTPHVAGWTYQSYARINEVLVDKIVAFLENHSND